MLNMISNNKYYTWLTIILGNLVAVLVVFYLTPLTSQTSSYLLLLLTTTLVGWREGFKVALFVIAFVSGITLASVYQSEFLSGNLFITLFEVGAFILTASLTAYLIEKYKKTDTERLYKKIVNLRDIKIKKLEEQSNKMKEEIKMRDEFLSIASHELKTPLTSMLLKIQLLLHNIRNVSLANFSVQNLLDMLETAEGQTKRLSQMISDLLNISLITTGKFQLERQNEDLSQIVKEVVKEFSEKLRKENYSLNLKVNGAVYANVDKVRIAQVLTNLLSNAIKYGNGKPIQVEVESKNNLATIAVADHGIGIDKNQKEKLFKLFERGVSKDNNIKGLGVGLFISNQIVKAHGAEIKIESVPQKGSTFRIELPVSTKPKT